SFEARSRLVRLIVPLNASVTERGDRGGNEPERDERNLRAREVHDFKGTDIEERIGTGAEVGLARIVDSEFFAMITRWCQDRLRRQAEGGELRVKSSGQVAAGRVDGRRSACQLEV